MKDQCFDCITSGCDSEGSVFTECAERTPSIPVASIYSRLSDRQKRRTSIDNVQDVLSVLGKKYLITLRIPNAKMMLAAQEAECDHGEHDEWLYHFGDDFKRYYKAMTEAGELK